ncbi:aldo/keto reductase [Lutispora thermophila]|uniref:4Fe-4S dicluster domain-containing protein n=1 Tax=Lutispora thermophila DSM 19022 TaxID=1122184 RepID=A0A1M6GUW2_9FIRM|nr:aldo/keto reductase [Lutispora thermophila]SHJ13699.1 4Fe-4S dicluster domain-containing protein [Lutispora thermophila DSM 19022]
MDRIILGNTGIEVTKLCFGALPLGPLQKNISVEEGGEIIANALRRGINFIDTAQIYRTYPHIKAALDKVDFRPVIATKSMAESYEDMERAIHEALEGLSLDYIDIFHLHAAKADTDIFEKRKGAFQCLLDYKKEGIIKAVGISTHSVDVVELAARREDVDVIFPLINKAGRGIVKGTLEDMERAIELCHENNKGVYLMKVLGGGTVIEDYQSCMDYAMNLSGDNAIAIGMVSNEEVDYNIRYFDGERDLEGIVNIRSKKVVKVSEISCVGCGTCTDICHSEAISINEKQKALIDTSKCIQCGYCISACPQFSIRIV